MLYYHLRKICKKGPSLCLYWQPQVFYRVNYNPRNREERFRAVLGQYTLHIEQPSYGKISNMFSLYNSRYWHELKNIHNLRRFITEKIGHLLSIQIHSEFLKTTPTFFLTLSYGYISWQLQCKTSVKNFFPVNILKP